MTNQEFIDNLSLKTKSIIQNYTPNFKNKTTIKIYVDEDSFAEYDENGSIYYIHVKEDASVDKMEYLLLHEFYHCVQRDEKFPTIVQKSDEYKEMVTFLSSTVLDLDVKDRLLRESFPYDDSELKGHINNITDIVRFSKGSGVKICEMYDINKYYHICSMIAHIRLNYSNKNDIERFCKLIQTDAPDIHKIQSTIYNTITKLGYNTPQKVYKIFKTLIRELKLTEYMRISETED